MYAVIFLCELILLFFLSRTLTNEVFKCLFLFTRSQRASMIFMSLIFFPGTVIHELSHALVAIVLLVPIGEMEFVPRLEGNSLKLGSVQVGRADPLRNFLIGVAPFLVGSTIIFLTIFYTMPYLFLDMRLVLFTGYVLFVVGNTMFSSKKDMEGTIKLFLFLLVVIGTLYLLGIKLPDLTQFLHNKDMSRFFMTASYFLLFPIGIDGAIILLAKLFQRR